MILFLESVKCRNYESHGGITSHQVSKVIISSYPGYQQSEIVFLLQERKTIQLCHLLIKFVVSLKMLARVIKSGVHLISHMHQAYSTQCICGQACESVGTRYTPCHVMHFISAVDYNIYIVFCNLYYKTSQISCKQTLKISQPCIYNIMGRRSYVQEKSVKKQKLHVCLIFAGLVTYIHRPCTACILEDGKCTFYKADQ